MAATGNPKMGSPLDPEGVTTRRSGPGPVDASGKTIPSKKGREGKKRPSEVRRHDDKTVVGARDARK